TRRDGTTQKGSGHGHWFVAPADRGEHHDESVPGDVKLENVDGGLNLDGLTKIPRLSYTFTAAGDSTAMPPVEIWDIRFDRREDAFGFGLKPTRAPFFPRNDDGSYGVYRHCMTVTTDERALPERYYSTSLNPGYLSVTAGGIPLRK